MTKKEFLSHEWKKGDVLYTVGHKRFEAWKIPNCIGRVEIRVITPEILEFHVLNRKMDKYIDISGFFTRDYFKKGYIYQNLYFDRKDALDALEEKKKEFVKEHLWNFRNDLKRKLQAMDRERQRIYGMFRMNIMNEYL